MDHQCPKGGTCMIDPDPELANYVYRGVPLCFRSCVRAAEMAEFKSENVRRIEAARRIT